MYVKTILCLSNWHKTATIGHNRLIVIIIQFKVSIRKLQTIVATVASSYCDHQLSYTGLKARIYLTPFHSETNSVSKKLSSKDCTSVAVSNSPRDINRSEFPTNSAA